MIYRKICVTVLEILNSLIFYTKFEGTLIAMVLTIFY